MICNIYGEIKKITWGISHLHWSKNSLVRLYIPPQGVILLLWLALRSREGIYQQVIDLHGDMKPRLRNAHTILRVKVLLQECMGHADDLGCNTFRPQQAPHLARTCNALLRLGGIPL